MKPAVWVRHVGGHGVILQHRANRRVWLAKRRYLLGATDAVAVLGMHPTRTPLGVWLEKTGRAGSDRVGDSYEARRGHALEGLLLGAWAEETGADLMPVPPLLRHPDFPHIGASLDGAGVIDGAVHLVDAKTAAWSKRDAWWDESTAAPDHYLAQVLVQLAVAGMGSGWLAADVAGVFQAVGPIPRDPQFEGWALPALERWWRDHVAADVPPDADPARDYPALNRAWVPDPGEKLHADDALAALVSEWRAARDHAVGAKRAADRLKGWVRIAMRNAATITYGDELVKLAALDSRGALTLPRKDPLAHTNDKGHRP